MYLGDRGHFVFHWQIQSTATYSCKCYVWLSLPLSTEWNKCQQVFEEACEADRTHANKILQQSLDEYDNKWVYVPTF